MCKKAGEAVAGFVLSAARSSSAGSTIATPAVEPASRDERLAELESIGEEHGVDVVFSDYQVCDHPVSPYASDSGWQTTGCHVDGDDHVTISWSTADLRVPWDNARNLVLHEAAHRTADRAGCADVLGDDDNERLADAISLLWGAHPLELTYGVTYQDVDLAWLVIEDGVCVWPPAAG